MLVLTRKVGESIIIDGRVVVTVLRMDGDSLKLGIDAPSEVAIHREEVYEDIQRTNRQALVSGRRSAPKLKGGNVL